MLRSLAYRLMVRLQLPFETAITEPDQIRLYTRIEYAVGKAMPCYTILYCSVQHHAIPYFTMILSQTIP